MTMHFLRVEYAKDKMKIRKQTKTDNEQYTTCSTRALTISIQRIRGISPIAVTGRLRRHIG